MSVNSEWARLLEHPAIWRGTRAARVDALPTGFGALDARLPGGGWPRSGLIEILIRRFGAGEMSLLLPLLAALTQRPSARWCAWIAPPLEPFPPSLAAHGLALNRILVVRVPPRSTGVAWAFEQSLRSGACDVALAWARRAGQKEIRRLQLAAEHGRTLGVLFRPEQAARQSSYATLRMSVRPAHSGLSCSLLKSKGGVRGTVEIDPRSTRG